MMPDDRIVAVGLLTKNDLDRLGETFSRLWPVQSVPDFDELIAAIDDADRELEQRNQIPADRS
jgi:hypothetical protein